LVHTKKIFVDIPNDLLKELDRICEDANTDRSKTVCEAMHYYVKRRKLIEYEIKIKECSKELAEINVTFSEMCSEIDNEQLHFYEEKLWEMEKA